MEKVSDMCSANVASHTYINLGRQTGPKNCSFYRAGATRMVPGRKGMVWEEADW